MPDRRGSACEEFIDRGGRKIGEPGNNVINFPRPKGSPAMMPASSSLLATIIEWRDDLVAVTPNPKTPDALPPSDLDERLRQSEQKKHQLQQRINALLNRD
jgi:hypothetical protein